MHRTRQRGAVLIVGLLMLLAMTIIGIASMSDTTLQEHMSGNLRQTNVAVQAAEAALRDAEQWLIDEKDAVPDPDTFLGEFSSAAGGTEGLYSVATSGPALNEANFIMSAEDGPWKAGGTQPMVTSLDHVDEQPIYVIEYLGVAPFPGQKSPVEVGGGYQQSPADLFQPGFFRITARAWGEGPNPTARQMLQSHYRLNVGLPEP